MQKPCFGLQALDIIIKLEYQGVSFDRSPTIPFIEPINSYTSIYCSCGYLLIEHGACWLFEHCYIRLKFMNLIALD